MNAAQNSSSAHLMKYFTYFLIFVFAENALLTNQVAKLPVLFSHFGDHQHRNVSLSFIEFLGLHYGSDIPNDQADQQDQELPFKKISAPSFTMAFMAPPVNLLTSHWAEQISSFGSAGTNLFTRTLLNSLFRPPRS